MGIIKEVQGLIVAFLIVALPNAYSKLVDLDLGTEAICFAVILYIVLKFLEKRKGDQDRDGQE